MQDYNRRIIRLKHIKYFALSVLFLCSIPKVYIEYEQPDPFKKDKNPHKPNKVIAWIIVGAMLVRIIENICVLLYAVFTIKYFVG